MGVAASRHHSRRSRPEILDMTDLIVTRVSVVAFMGLVMLIQARKSRLGGDGTFDNTGLSGFHRGLEFPSLLARPICPVWPGFFHGKIDRERQAALAFGGEYRLVFMPPLRPGSTDPSPTARAGSISTMVNPVPASNFVMLPSRQDALQSMGRPSGPGSGHS